MRFVRGAVLVPLLVGWLAAPCAAEWRRLDSPNFTVIGDVSARELRDLAVKFEGFREALSRALSERATATAVPTVIIVFPDDKSFTPFKPLYQGKPRSEVRGFFARGLNVNYILLESRGPESDHVVFHEYAHLIVSNLMPNPPVWLNEGMAEFYSTFKLMDGGRRAQIGVPIVEHLQLLHHAGRVPLEELLKVDARSPLYNESARASVFYAESWALTHMIFNGLPPRLPELSAYLRAVGDGVPEARAWEATFGTDRTEQDFRRYLSRNLYGTVLLEFSDRIADFQATPTVLPPAEVAAFLGAYLAQHHQYEEAAAQIEQAFKADPGSPRASIALAQIEMDRQQYASAEKRLLGLGPSSDWLVAYSAAMAMTELTGVGVAGSPNPDLIAAADRQLAVVQGLRADIPNVLAHRAALTLAGVDDPGEDARAAIARARALSPGRSDFAFIQAQILARRGEFAAARDTIGPLMSGAYQPAVRESARSLMGYIVQAEQRRQAGNRDDAAPSPTASDRKSVPVPGVDNHTRPTGERKLFVADYRPLQAGEQRYDGMLERIDCASGRATFRVSDAGAPGPFVGQLREIDFIAYRDDLSGGVACGVLPQPMHVYITWRPKSPAGAQQPVVAVEFLPK
jgi:hypothetical protein